MCRQNTIAIAITDPSPAIEEWTRNRRGFVVIRGRYTPGLEKLVPAPEMAPAGQNQITERGLFASHPRTASRNIQTIALPHPWKTVESSRESLQPTSPWTPWTVERDTAISANDSSNVHRIQISTVLFRAFG